MSKQTGAGQSTKRDVMCVYYVLSTGLSPGKGEVASPFSVIYFFVIPIYIRAKIMAEAKDKDVAFPEATVGTYKEEIWNADGSKRLIIGSYVDLYLSKELIDEKYLEMLRASRATGAPTDLVGFGDIYIAEGRKPSTVEKVEEIAFSKVGRTWLGTFTAPNQDFLAAGGKKIKVKDYWTYPKGIADDAMFAAGSNISKKFNQALTADQKQLLMFRRRLTVKK